jgi:hypothetical protein
MSRHLFDFGQKIVEISVGYALLALHFFVLGKK